MPARKKAPRDILIVYSDETDRVARKVVGLLIGGEMTIIHRNIRYGYNPIFYDQVYTIGLSDARITENSFHFKYIPYLDYLSLKKDKEDALRFEDYIRKEAELIVEEISGNL